MMTMAYAIRNGFLREWISCFFQGNSAELPEKAVQHNSTRLFQGVRQVENCTGKTWKFISLAQKPSARSFGRDFPYPVFLFHREPLHQPCKLLRRDLTDLGCCPWPLKTSGFQPFVNKQEPIAFPCVCRKTGKDCLSGTGPVKNAPARSWTGRLSRNGDLYTHTPNICGCIVLHR